MSIDVYRCLDKIVDLLILRSEGESTKTSDDKPTEFKIQFSGADTNKVLGLFHFENPGVLSVFDSRCAYTFGGSRRYSKPFDRVKHDINILKRIPTQMSQSFDPYATVGVFDGFVNYDEEKRELQLFVGPVVIRLMYLTRHYLTCHLKFVSIP